MKKYRIDNSYGTVYEYDKEAKAYIFFGKFHVFGITPKMSESQQIKRIERSLNNEE